MDDRTIQIRVGVVVVTAAVIAFLLVLFFGEKRALFQPQKTIYMTFPTAPNVSPQTPVRKNGVLIGRIIDVQLLDEGGVLLTARIEATYKVRRNELPRISTSSLLPGDAVVEFVPSGDEGASGEEIGDEEVISNGIVPSDPLRVLVNLESKIGEVLSSIELAANEVTLLARNTNTIVGNNQDQFQRVMQKSELAMEHFRSAMETVDEVIGDPELKANIKRSLQEFPGVLDDARTTLAKARETLDGFQTMSARADQNLQNLEHFTKPLSERGDRLAERLESAVTNVDTLLEQLVQFSSQLNNREGTLGRLLYDKDLYNELLRSAKNIQEATRRLRPILDDARILSDKLATDPRLLGAKGALDSRPSGTGTKHAPSQLRVPSGYRYQEPEIWVEELVPGDGGDATREDVRVRTGRVPWRKGPFGSRFE